VERGPVPRAIADNLSSVVNAIRHVRFDVALATAHLRSAQHRFDDASRTIRPALQSVVAVGCVRCQLQARLELGEIEMQAGNAQRGRAQLHQLGDEAASRGFQLIAERAAADSR
jgi:hypothetical protein